MKKLLTFIFIGFLTLAGYSLFANNERQFSAPLTHTYQIYNDAYFDGNLPQNLKVYLGPAEGNAAIIAGIGDPSREYIEINPKYNPINQELEMSLLHEMCHCATGTSEFEEHGPKWHKCMKNLAAEGAFDDLW